MFGDPDQEMREASLSVRDASKSSNPNARNEDPKFASKPEFGQNTLSDPIEQLNEQIALAASGDKRNASNSSPTDEQAKLLDWKIRAEGDQP